ncbi:TAFII55 protein conserved region-domain-containing protein [Phakopsora pachyrhizi]|uniref:TAFII55 protein conserved region-domain-containing protein n=1 Tax=Phakopsora pachyrhizi TaxID=170000 RepID=A0AAV0AXH9_PHAPC|nr:TAFII55 protein conserved region-domain-containing protein [Phakopsora pachyrhizi]
MGIDSYLQGYDRELDSDPEEPMAFEEQFILKMPPGPDCERLRELVEKRKDIESSEENVYLMFKDSRRGIFNIGKKMFGMKLVDLPCIIESQKTFDNKHLFKVADICQMVLVDDTPISDESTVTQGNFNIEDFIYPHGITPPLHHVRKRRFRKRLNKRTIETVERAVERLLEEDSRADQVIIDIVDNVRDLSDSEGDEHQPPMSAQIGGTNPLTSKIVYNKPKPNISINNKLSNQNLDSAYGQSKESIRDPGNFANYEQDGSHQPGMAQTPAGDSMSGQTPAADLEDFDEQAAMALDDEEGSIDSDLAAEIEAGLMEGAAAEERAAAGLTGPEDGEEGEEDDSEDLFGNGDDDDEEDDDDDDDDDEEESLQMVEDRQRVKLLQGEVKDLEVVVNRKRGEIAKAANVILKRRFEEALKKLSNELESKKTQLNTAQLNLQNAAEERKNQREKQENGQLKKHYGSRLSPGVEEDLVQAVSHGENFTGSDDVMK